MAALYDHETLPSDWTIAGMGGNHSGNPFSKFSTWLCLFRFYSVSRYGSIAVVYHARAGPKRPRLAAPVQGAGETVGLSQFDQKLMASHATLGVITYMIIHAKLPELPGRQISGDVWFRPMIISRLHYPCCIDV